MTKPTQNKETTQNKEMTNEKQHQEANTEIKDKENMEKKPHNAYFVAKKKKELEGMKRNRFLLRNQESLRMNQYWYSASTVETMVAEITENSKKAAFLSTPSVFFSIKSKELRANSALFDYDKRWSKEAGFVFFDYKKPENIPKIHHHVYDYVVIDPPFITEDTWEKYAEAAKTLLVQYDSSDENPKGKILLSTIPENEALLASLLNVRPQVYQPILPNLIYQYEFYCNYPSERLKKVNPEAAFFFIGKKGYGDQTKKSSFPFS